MFSWEFSENFLIYFKEHIKHFNIKYIIANIDLIQKIFPFRHLW